jgi:hypothetical protein
MICTLFIHGHRFTFKHLCLHSITKILRNGPRAHFPFKDKTANLVLFGCGALFWAIWRTRNDWCFGNKHLLDLSNIIFLCCFWLDFWATRQNKKEQKIVVLGSKLIRKTASEAFGRAFGWCPLDRHISG